MRLDALRASFSLRMAQLSTQLASDSAQQALAWATFLVGCLSAFAAILFSFPARVEIEFPDVILGIPDSSLALFRWWLPIPTAIAVISFCLGRSTVTRAAGRMLGGLALVLTTAALSNSFIDGLQQNPSQPHRIDLFYVTAQFEHRLSVIYLWYTIAGAAFVLAAEFMQEPMRDDRLLPAPRPPWLARLLAILALGSVLLAFSPSSELKRVTMHNAVLADWMTLAAIFGVLGLLSPVPVLRRLGWLAVAFASIVAGTAWGVLEGLRYAQRVPDPVRSDLTKGVLWVKPDLPKKVIDGIINAQDLYHGFFLFLALGLLFSWWHSALRRVSRHDL
jgi:hypothetical protein